MNFKLKTGFAIAATALSLFAGVQGASAETKMRMTTSLPAPSFLYKDVLQVWADRVKESSGGELEIELFPAGTLGRDPATHYDMVRDGVAQIGYIVPGYTPGTFPAATVVELPGLVPSATAGGLAGAKLVEDGLIGANTADNVKILGFFTGAPTWLHTTDKKVETLDDVKGLKLRGAGPALLSSIDAIGGTPIGGITVTNLAESLSRGLVDGTVNEWVAATIFGVSKSTTYHLDVNMGTSPLMVIMNKSAYEGLSPELKKAIDDNSGAAFSKLWGDEFDKYIDIFLSKAKEDTNRTFTKPSAEEQAKWDAALQPVIDNWIAETPNGQAIYDAYLAALADAQK
ncbi:TRAP transporter substrate-binding protein [Pseudooceanicola sp. MF1-13]|uniref:TRAP transporter substrate-binding protein n=1 Tax=Pseudooceanicola sp. MF1-13 TaxID=3379095 RepID=UPI0038929056